jgi:thioesterase domain-containing protein
MALNIPDFLNEFFASDTPAAGMMGISVGNYTDSELVLNVPIEPNLNDKGTCFAGSMYSAAVLAGWGMATAKLIQENLQTPVVIVSSSTRYLAPVTRPFASRCRAPSPEVWLPFVERVKSGENGRIELQVEILQDGETVAVFSGSYAALRKKQQP